MKKFEILTLFPEVFPATLGVSIFKKSFKKAWDLKIHDLRKYGVGKNKKVDDEVFSYLPGMLIRPDVIENAIQAVNFKGRKIFLSPRGAKLTQKKVEELAADKNDIMLLCGRYDGVDQRAIDHFDFEELSVGDYIISGGEAAALILMEAIIRKLPGVVGNHDVFLNETFENNEISEPRFTRPAKWLTYEGKTLEVDSILLSGDHEKIKKFQKKQRKKID